MPLPLGSTQEITECMKSKLYHTNLKVGEKIDLLLIKEHIE
jgi:hypothetical protein